MAEIVQGTHLEAIMKSAEWQQKMLRGSSRITRLKDKDSNERRNKKLPGHRAKYATRLKQSSSSIFTARMYQDIFLILKLINHFIYTFYINLYICILCRD